MSNLADLLVDNPQTEEQIHVHALYQQLQDAVAAARAALAELRDQEQALADAVGFPYNVEALRYRVRDSIDEAGRHLRAVKAGTDALA